MVAGRVQGVYYRASAQQRAQRAGIVGYARNVPDGTVEVLVCGDETVVQDFIAWLWKGPAAAKVTDVVVEPVELQPGNWPPEFSTF